MSVLGVTMFRVICDWADCPNSPQDDTDYFAWGEPEQAEETASDADYRTGRDGETHYCLDHPATWASDHEMGEPFPPKPFLLIHDGDTDEPDDDCKVTLIEADS